MINDRFNPFDDEENRMKKADIGEIMRTAGVKRDPNLIGLELTGAKTTGQDVDKLMPAGFQRAGTAAAEQLAYEKSTASAMQRTGRAEALMNTLVRGGANADLAAKLATDATVPVDQAMREAALRSGALTPKIDSYGNITGFEPAGQEEKYISTQRGVFSTRDRGIIGGTEPVEQPDSANIRQLATDRARTFGGTNIEAGKTADSYWNSTYDENGRLKPGSNPNPTIENWIDYLNRAFESAGQISPYKRASASPSAAGGGEAAISNATGRTGAPAAAIEYLRQHPETLQAFRDKYGYVPEGF